MRQPSRTRSGGSSVAVAGSGVLQCGGMKRAFLIHGWGGTPEHGFFPWLRRELESRGYAVEAPNMPDADAPAALRMLERLPAGTKLGRVILVAPVIDQILAMSPEEEVVARPWLDRPLAWDRIGGATDALIGIFSDDDRWIPVEGEALVRAAGGQTLALKGRGHFSGGEGCHDLPELLNYL